MKRYLFGYNRDLRRLLAINSVIIFTSAMLAPIYAVFVANIGGGVLEAGSSWAVFMLAAAVATYVAGDLIDHRHNKMQILGFAYLLLAFAFLYYLTVDSLMDLYVVQFLIGIATALYAPGMDSLYADSTTPTKEGREWATLEASEYLVGGVGALAGGLLVNAYGFAPLFLLMALLSALSALYLFTHQSTDA